MRALIYLGMLGISIQGTDMRVLAETPSSSPAKEEQKDSPKTILSSPNINLEVKPDDFVNVADLIPNIQIDMRYFTNNNFVGRPITGYLAPICYLTRPAAEKLAEVQRRLARQKLALRVFDCYRPQRAVDDFVQWGKDLTDQKHKAKYYPNVPKESLFLAGYIAEKSGHSRGSTIDLTIVSLHEDRAPEELDMGTDFDYFGVESHTAYPKIAPTAAANRLLLKTVMEENGFVNFPQEWWHYTFKPEPYPETYFNFSIASIAQSAPSGQ